MTPIIEARLADNPEMADKAGQVVPMQKIGEPETIAEAVTWLCSDESSYVTGQCLTVDGGVMAQMLPRQS